MHLQRLRCKVTAYMSEGESSRADGCLYMLTYLRIMADEDKLTEVER